MANEIKFRATIEVTKGFLKRSLDSGSVAVTMSGTVVNGPVDLALTTSYASIGKGSVGSCGWLWVRNTHATVAMRVSMDAGVTDHFALAAGQAMLAPLDAAITIANVRAKSVTDPGKCEYAVFEL